MLAQHGVECLLVGGVAARLYGATRATRDLDCVIRRTHSNLDRLAAALQELRARLNVTGLSDEEAAALPVQIDAETIARMEISTWRTDAGDLDILANMPDRSGRHMVYEELYDRSRVITHDELIVRVAGLDDIIASKEWANRPKDRLALPELYELASLPPKNG